MKEVRPSKKQKKGKKRTESKRAEIVIKEKIGTNPNSLRWREFIEFLAKSTLSPQCNQIDKPSEDLCHAVIVFLTHLVTVIMFKH